MDKTLEANYWRLKRNKSIVKKLGLLFAKHYFSKRHNYVKSRNASFSDYFLKYYKYPYMDWNILAHKRFNHVIRFENLNDDFQKVLDLLGLESKRDLPLVNKTKGRDREFLSYFDEKSILRAKKVFGIYLKELNYEFPSEWGTHEISNIERFKFEMKLIIMKIYWRIVYFE